MAVLTLNSNGSISLENYNNYSTESFGGAVKAVFKKIWEKIVAVINFIKKLFQKLFSRKNKKKEAIEQLREDIRKAEECVNENIKNDTEEKNNDGETNSSNMNNDTRIERVEIVKFNPFKRYTVEEVQNIIKKSKITADILEKNRDIFIQKAFKHVERIYEVKLMDDERENDIEKVLDDISTAVREIFSNFSVYKKYNDFVNDLVKKITEACKKDDILIFRKDYISDNSREKVIKSIFKYNILTDKVLKEIIPDYENKSQEEMVNFILESDVSFEDIMDTMMEVDKGSYAFGVAKIVFSLAKLANRIDNLDGKERELSKFTSSEDFLRKMNLLTSELDKIKNDFKKMIDGAYLKLENSEKSSYSDKFANFMKSFMIDIGINEHCMVVNRIAKFYYILDEIYTKMIILFDKMLKEDLLTNAEGEATDGSINT